MKPDVILFYWYGTPIPQWRLECHNKLVALYPGAHIIKSEGVTVDFKSYDGDHWRLQQCSTCKRALWVDNDIELAGPLDLTEKPAVADEYNSGHISICWSGDNPRAFKNLSTPTSYKYVELQERVKSGLIDKIKINGTHWTTSQAGEKVKR
jgi:hypothetical protein